ncbi:MAG: aminotransferase class I/II-fold pyridoxal phosphate-dependent enzyme [Betaproteobacteria bacterium]|nr:aminotransferase class I/II-fold pyridoxal phosphate-dependent enzyme [Betaproteobacteria bacterium]
MTRSASRFARMAGVRRLNQRIATQMELAGRIPFFQPHLGVNGAAIDLGQGPLINFSSYNYLGLCGHPEVSAAAKAAIDRYGTSVSASRIVSGEIPLHRELEQELADFVGAEDCLVFVGGYNTNVTTIGHLYGRRDLILYDEQSHNSIVSGTLLSRAERKPFRHNDVHAVERLLREHRKQYGRVLVVVEGLYSMHGDLPDLAHLREACQRHDADLMVDEAHSLGVLGAAGRGLAEHCGLSGRSADIHMGTLSKALASCGGFIAGDANLVQYLRFLAPGFIFSVGLPPADTAAALAALRILRREPERVERLRANSRAFRRLMHEAGFAVDVQGVSPIIPLHIGDQYRCMQVSHDLLERGIHVQPVIYPAVPQDGALLRFFICADHTLAQLEAAVGQLAATLTAS